MKSIYIILSQTGTLFSRAIGWYTGDPYNHASIAFDRSLKEMYSFGRKTRYNPFTSGFVQENFETGIYSFFPQARCCVLEIPVTDEEYEAMYKMAMFFLSHQQIYRYNLLGVLGYSVGIKITRKNRFFCSQFVSFVLNNAEFWDRIPEFTKPLDFCQISNKKLVFEGFIKEYSKKSLCYVPTTCE